VGVLTDLRQSLASLRRSPGFTLAAALTIALGISANASIFGIVDGVLLRPLPFPESERLVRITGDLTKRGVTDVGLDVPQLGDYGTLTDVFAGVSGVYPANANLTAVAEPERIEGQLVSANYFQVLGVSPALGRVFVPADEQAGETVAVISDALWRRRFGADPHVIGRLVRLDTDPVAIVGVLPAGFHHPGRQLAADTEIFQPTSYADAAFGPPIRGNFRLQGAIARLKPGVTPRQAQERLAALGRALVAANPGAYPDSLGWSPRIVALQDDLVGGVRRTLLTVFAAVGALLLVACANVASLLLARAITRQHEFTVRAALGASRWRLIRVALAEGCVLAALGCGVGLVATRGLVGLFVALAPVALPRAAEIQVDWRVFLFAIGLATLTGLVFSVWPAFQSSRSDGRAALTSRSTTADPRRLRARRLVVVSELATALALLVVAALLGRSLLALSRVDPGFSYDRVLTAKLWMSLPSNPSAGPYATREKQVDLLSRSIQRVEALPGIVRAGWTSALPFDSSGLTSGFLIEGHTVDSSLVDVAEPLQVTPGYFDTMRIRLVRGRIFVDTDTATTTPVMVISEAVARRYFPGADPIGRRVRPGGPASTAPWLTIVGVVSDVRSVRLDADPGAQIYRCAWQRPNLAMTLIVRTAGAPAAEAESVRLALRAIDPDVPLFKVQPMDAVLGASLTQPRFALRLIALFAGLAVLLASIGIYGLVSQIVAQRTSEIGIRMALGASPRDVLKMIVRQGLILTLSGIAAGLVLASIAARIIAGLLFAVAPSDPTVYAGVALVLGVVGFVACLPAARRATRIDPLQAIRQS
jgi:predicted permease